MQKISLSPWRISELVENVATRSQIQTALAQWHAPNAAAEIAEHILKAIGREIPAETKVVSGGKLEKVVV